MTKNLNSLVISLSILLSAFAIMFTLANNSIIAYGDAESHLNIAKRVVSGLTPGLAQLGGVWLPLPHLLMIPFLTSDFLWRTGLAGAFVSGTAYVVSCFMIFKISKMLFKNTVISFITFLFFALNPNALYLQTTAMTELPFIAFFLLSFYFFAKYLKNTNDYLSVSFAALFVFCGVLTRYDGWILIPIGIGIFILQFLFKKIKWAKAEGYIVLFGVLALFGVVLWLAWDGLILHDPLYFINSSFSAKAQQQIWINKGELPTYKNLLLSFSTYMHAIIANLGIFSSTAALVGLIALIFYKKDSNRFYYLLLLLSPVIFNVYSLWAGNSVLLVPSVAPVNYEWHIFNARYATVMIASSAILIGYLLTQFSSYGRFLIVYVLVAQIALFYIGAIPVTTYDDAILGLSAGFDPNSIYYTWVKAHYDGGYVLMDDYLRPVSIIKSGIPMQNIIYVGTKPYYEDSFKEPQKYARWIFIGKGDDVWEHLYLNPNSRKLLDKYFVKALVTPNYTLYKLKGANS